MISEVSILKKLYWVEKRRTLRPCKIKFSTNTQIIYE